MQAQQSSLVQLHIRDKAMLQACYMPFILGGGLFIPSQQSVKIGELVVILATLLEQVQQTRLTGQVVWVSPKSTGIKPQGFAVQLSGEQGELYRIEIEKILFGTAESIRPSFTL